MWPAVYAYPDLAYSLRVLSSFCKNSGPIHVELIKHVLQYVSWTLDLGLTFDGEANTPNDVVRYTDSDFVESKIDWKSTGSYVFMHAGAAISHSSKLPLIVALSTCETEYVAMCKAGKETVCLGYLLGKRGFWKKSTPVTLYVDNQGSIVLSNNTEFYWQTKHIDIWLFDLQSCVNETARYSLYSHSRNGSQQFF